MVIPSSIVYSDMMLVRFVHSLKKSQTLFSAWRLPEVAFVSRQPPDCQQVNPSKSKVRLIGLGAALVTGRTTS